MSLGWKFPRLDGGPKQGINDGGVSTFTGSKLYNSLAREICQNSLDAKKEGEKTVKVEFKEQIIKIDDFDCLKELKDVFSDVKEYTRGSDNPKLESFLNEADKALSSDSVNFLVIRDYNTTGLDGSKNADEDTPWLALTHSNGISVKGSGSQGSYGIGKNSPFACSSLRTVFYNSYSEKEKIKAFTGVTKLVTHKDANDELTIGTGYYENTETRMPIFEEDPCEFRDLFLRNNETGTDVIIAGFKKSETWKADIEKAVIRNYFVSIAKGLLIVDIDGLELSSQNIKERIDFYKANENGDSENGVELASEFYETYMDPTIHLTGSIITENDVELFVRMDDHYSKMIAEMRATCMLVKSRKQNRFARYAAVVIVNDGPLNDMLKTIEPASHDEWDPNIEEDITKQRKVRQAKNKLYKWIRDSLDEICKGKDTDEFDLDGISAYLGYEDDDNSLSGTEDEEVNLLDSDSKIGDGIRRNKQIVIRKKPVTAIKTKGIKNDSFDSNNDSKGGSKKGNAGEEDSHGKEDIKVPKEGGKNINRPVVIKSQRIVMMPANGIYKAMFSTEKDYKTVRLSLKAITDDGNNEDLVIQKYKMNNKEYKIDSNEIVLNDIKADTRYELFLSLQYREQMALMLSIQ